MFEEACGQSSMQEKMRILTYRMLYQNVRNRLCGQEEILSYDFLNGEHDELIYLQRYKYQPMRYTCRERIGYIGMCILESKYLVVAGGQKVVVLRDPEQAVARQQPFLMVLDGKQFVPHLGCPTEFWQQYIEPVVRETGSVLPGNPQQFPSNVLLMNNNVLLSRELRA